MPGFREFVSELKRRHVYRVAVAYGLVAWVMVQAASIVVPELLLPPWITRAVIVLALLGFPLALVLAWAYDITPEGVQRSAARDGSPAAPSSGDADGSEGSGSAAFRTPGPRAEARRAHATQLMSAAVVLVLLIGGAGAWAVRSREAAVPVGEALHAELTALAAAGRYVDAIKLQRGAEAAGETVPDSLVLRYTDHLTVISEPADARVEVLRFESGLDPLHARWLDLGRTPLRGVAIARGDYLMRVTVAGHAAVERIVSSAETRSVFTDQVGSEVRVDVRLASEGDVPHGMVFVPGGSYRIASRDLQTLSATIDDFVIDRFEVTHGDFAAFVDAGGYTRDEHWTDLNDDASALRRSFTDRTGLPAPRSWSGQQPPADVRTHPVTGVTWFEAAAYCRSRRARLPTLFEWEKTARDGRVARGQGIDLPWGYVGPRDPGIERANLGGSGTVPVGSYPFGISAYGAHDMAGNAKEWLLNRTEAGRAVTGGSWADPIYVFSEVGSVDPATASATIGFRCARAADTGSTVRHGPGDVALSLAVATPEYRPVDEATFRMLLAHYDYDPRPLDAVVEQRVQEAGWARERITYAGPGGDRVIAYLYTPRIGNPPWQTIVYVPNSAAFFGSALPTLTEQTVGPLVRAGRALFTVVMYGMTERPVPAGWQLPPTNSVAFRDLMVRHATELRLGLDYLETRDDIDAGALAYVGTSWGAGSRLLFAATDPRFRATVLIGAGIDERVHPTLPEASNINFAPYIRGPKLMVNGREDEEHPWLTRALPLWNLLSEPKELALFDEAGHVPPPELRIPAIRDFLDRTLR